MHDADLVGLLHTGSLMKACHLKNDIVIDACTLSNTTFTATMYGLRHVNVNMLHNCNCSNEAHAVCAVM
jgi:hypothetical protein